MSWICRVAPVRILFKLTVIVTLTGLLVVGLVSLLRPQSRWRLKYSNKYPISTKVKADLPRLSKEEDILYHLRLLHGRDYDDLFTPYFKERLIFGKHSQQFEENHQPLLPQELQKKKEQPRQLPFKKATEKQKKSLPIKEAKTEGLSVVIVEEHHEVLPFWFQQADTQSNGQHQPYTVVHFDAHSDFGPLSYKPSLPLFQWPKSKREISMLMQRNDVFVMASIGTGLVNRFIWVWPGWTEKENGKMYGNHTSGMVSLGTFTYKEKQDPAKKGMCVCFNKVQKDGRPSNIFKDSLKRSCLFAKPELEPYMHGGVRCDIKVKNVSFNFVREEYMSRNFDKILPFRSSKTLTDRVIVDIDEDYFGCEDSSRILSKSGLSWEHIDEINKRLCPFFCPKTSKHEQQLSVVIPNLLLSNCTEPLAASCVSMFHSHLSAVRKTRCSNQRELAYRIKDLRMYIRAKLNSSQLKGLTKIGFCMSRSPNTASIAVEKENNAMVVCIGGDKSKSAETIPKVSKKEISNEAIKVQKVLDKLSRIELVTVARSNRDGFVHRGLQPYIERQILDIAQTYSRHHHTKTSIIYGDNLMASAALSTCVT